MAAKILLVVEGMYLQADSIAYDAAFQYRALTALGAEVEVFVDRFGRQHYPDVPARPIADLAPALARGAACVVYHWVDGWHEIDALLRESAVPTIVRWHNNTPPWFFAPYSPIPTQKTVRGFSDLLRFAERAPRARFWVNSAYSRRQLAILGVDERRTAVVHPASHDVEHGAPLDLAGSGDGANGTGRARPGDAPDEGRSAVAAAARELRLLFVGRVVPHKGHKHVLAAAHAVQQLAGRPVRAVFPGRSDPDMPRYPAELRALSARLGVAMELPGEVSHQALARAYAEADVFVGLSEHEGFGLPIIEAMVRRLPVVGYRSTAVADLLEDHPLGCDDLDPLAVARRILVAAEDDVLRRAIVDWQVRGVLPRFARDAVVAQLRAEAPALGLGIPPVVHAVPEAGPVAAPAPCDPPRAEVAAALRRRESAPPPGLDLPALASDFRDHLVTRYDLAAYQALLKSSASGSLRERALDFRFGSHRPLLGKVLSLLKRMSLRLQDGLVRTIEISHNDLEHDLAALSDKIDLLAAELGRRPRPVGDASPDASSDVPSGAGAPSGAAARDGDAGRARSSARAPLGERPRS